jgi:predicted lipoprotein with Yx(FWY)xxD motif
LSRATLHALAGVVAAGALAVAASAAATPLVRTAHNAHLDTTILVNRQGHTLYDLSVERRGRFICTTKTCLTLWHPLVVAKGTKPRGSVSLGTIARPDGRTQVTYKGAPLYTFAEDVKLGDVRGEGFKDVGVWHAAATRAAAGAKTAPPSGGAYTYP